MNRFVRLFVFVFMMLSALSVINTNAIAQPLVFLPFSNNQEVRCVQGNNGNFSHRGSLSNAYDFDRGPGPNSDRNPAYGLPIHSPVEGVVTVLLQGIRDFQNNGSANNNNHGGYGNTIVIEFVDHQRRRHYMRFAHLQHGSIPANLRVGSSVSQGAFIGRIGQTGYSTTPHLHLHISTTTYGASIPFHFVEGPVFTGTTIRSQLEPRKFIVDNDGRATAGAHAYNTSGRLSGTWSNYNWIAPAFGLNYRGSTTSRAYFRWIFSIDRPARTSIRYQMYARCPNHSNRDVRANYVLTTSASNNRYEVNIDQRRIGSNPAYLGFYQHNGGSHTITLQANRSGGTLCADGIIFYW